MKSLAATFLAMLFVDTIGSVDPKNKIYLPSPRVYFATFLLWGALGLVAGLSDRAARLAGRLGALVLLTAAVIGPFGKRAVGFVEATVALQGGTP